eukprot:716079_1
MYRICRRQMMMKKKKSIAIQSTLNTLNTLNTPAHHPWKRVKHWVDSIVSVQRQQHQTMKTEEDEATEQKKKETSVPTPISTTSNYSNRPGHMRKATPAEMPSVKAIKKFSINLNETPLCEEMEEFTPRADQD